MTGQPVELPEPWRSAALTIVLPTYNEAANLPVIVAELLSLPLTGLRILVADDNSPDGTGVVADELARQYGADRVTVMHRPGKQGLGRAYVDGMTAAMHQACQPCPTIGKRLATSSGPCPPPRRKSAAWSEAICRSARSR